MTKTLSIVHCTVSHMYMNTCMSIEFLLLTLSPWFTLAPAESNTRTVSV